MVTTPTNGSRPHRRTRVPTPAAVQSSVQSDMSPSGAYMGGAADPANFVPLVFQFASAADAFTPWGINPKVRDLQLRSFWPTEDVLAGTVYTVAARNASFNFALRGPRDITSAVLTMLHEANFGAGWMDFIIKDTVDLTCTDNGSFIELIRSRDSEEAPVVGIANLDSWRCRRTGNWTTPVVYTDINGRDHLLKWYQVIAQTEFPSPIQSARGIQLCALSRALRSAQTARDAAIYIHEKLSGRNPKSIYLVTGFTNKNIQDALMLGQVEDDNRGLARYSGPKIVTQPDPNAKASVEKLDMAGLPDGWDARVFFNEYIDKLCIAFGLDHQDLAPLAGGNLGTGAQSQILHLKSRGKSPALYMKSKEHLFNFHGVVPRSCHFEYDAHDVESEKQEAELLGMQARALGGLIKALDLPAQAKPDANSTAARDATSPKPASGFTKALEDSGIDPMKWSMAVRKVFIQLANDIGIIPAEYLPLLGISDISPSRVVTDSGEVETDLEQGADQAASMLADKSAADSVASEVERSLRPPRRRHLLGRIIGS